MLLPRQILRVLTVSNRQILTISRVQNLEILRVLAVRAVSNNKILPVLAVPLFNSTPLRKCYMPYIAIDINRQPRHPRSAGRTKPTVPTKKKPPLSGLRSIIIRKKRSTMVNTKTEKVKLGRDAKGRQLSTPKPKK